MFIVKKAQDNIPVAVLKLKVTVGLEAYYSSFRSTVVMVSILRNFSLRSNVVISCYALKFESEKNYCSKVSQIVYSSMDYSSSVNIFAPDCQRYLNKATILK